MKSDPRTRGIRMECRSVRFTLPQEKKLAAEARRLSVTPSDIIRLAVDEYFTQSMTKRGRSIIKARRERLRQIANAEKEVYGG